MRVRLASRPAKPRIDGRALLSAARFFAAAAERLAARRGVAAPESVDLVLHGDRAYIYYFAHLSRPRGQRPGAARPDGLSPNTTFIQVAELRCDDGKTLTCHRNALTSID